MGLEIRLLGKPAIIDSDGQIQLVRGHQAWALLARILLSRRALDRRKIASELFPDTDDPLGSLRWCLASLRRALKSAEALQGDPIASNLPSGTKADVLNLKSGDIDIETAGDLLEGVEPRCSAEFATWLLVERERIAGLIDTKIRQDVMQAVSVSDYNRAIRMAELGVRRAPLDEGAHILLVKSLTLAGRQKVALEHVAATERNFLLELGEKPTAALRSASLRATSSPLGGIATQAVVKSLIASGVAALSGGAVEAGIDSLRQAVDQAEKCQDRMLQALSLVELGTALVHSVRGYDDEGAILLRQSIELADQSGAEEIAIEGFREIGYVEALAGRRPAAAEYLERALKLANDAGSRAGVHGVIGFNLVDWGKVDSGLEHFDLSIELAREADNRRRQVWALGIGAWGQLAAGRLEKAENWLVECLEIIDDLRWVSFRPWPMAVLAETRLRQGIDAQTLRSNLEEAFALSCQLRDPCWEAIAARVMALTFAAEEEYDRAAEWFVEARERCVRETDIYAALQVGILSDQADTCIKSGRSAQAKSIARELLSLAARLHMDHHIHRAIAIIEK